MLYSGDAVLVKVKRRSKGGVSRILLLVTAIVIITSILIMYYVSFQLPSAPLSSKVLNNQFIPLYVDTLTYRVSIDEVSSIVSKVVEESGGRVINLVSFGSTTCPHCKNLNRLFEKHFKGRYLFLWIDESQDSAAIFRKLIQIEQNSGVPMHYAYSVPQTIVIKDGEPVAIVVGSILDVSFWQNLLS